MIANFEIVNGEKVLLTAEEISAREAEEAAFIAYRAANGYKSARAASYPPLGEQLDLLWHAIDADADLKVKLSGFYNAIKAVKDANPKPS
tara:strand:+ start:236 stop:505 length:270 start_codon:yes stop_codon:yes gene_type:complete